MEICEDVDEVVPTEVSVYVALVGNFIPCASSVGRFGFSFFLCQRTKILLLILVAFS